MWGWIVVLLVACPLGGGFLVPTERASVKGSRCESTRASGMYGVDCRKRDLVEVPQRLSQNIEVLELSYNRIRDLYNSSFVKYTYVRYLFLDENIISYVEQAAFAPMEDLEVLNLAWNSLHIVPESIYTLPVLTKLVLSRNPFSGGIIQFREPLRSVELLDISDCKLTELPQLEALPRLLTLNASSNFIKTLNVHQLAPLCRLRTVSLLANSALFKGDKSGCECTILSNWTEMRRIRMQPPVATLCRTSNPQFDNSTCFNNETDTLFQESMAIARSCEAQVSEYGSGPIRLKGSLLWTIGIITALAVLLVCFGSVYCVRRRHRTPPHEDLSEEESITKSRS